jgi:hypothetical protein
LLTTKQNKKSPQKTKAKVHVKVMNFPYSLLLRELWLLNMYSPKTDSWKETPNTRVELVSVH